MEMGSILHFFIKKDGMMILKEVNSLEIVHYAPGVKLLDWRSLEDLLGPSCREDMG
jgi:hypothetical protein